MDNPSRDPSPSDRRQEARLAGEGHIHAAVVDVNRQPLVVLHDVQVANVSAGGLALVSRSSVPPASRIAAVVGDNWGPDIDRRRLTLEVLECSRQHNGGFLIRCRVLEGQVPARLIYNWFAGRKPPVPA